jgi:hypothetical protein
VGKLYTSEEGNQLGRIFGDEYYADLDLIEIVERGKVRGIIRLIFISFWIMFSRAYLQVFR